MPTVKSVYFGLGPEEKYDDGRRPSIAVNASKRVVEAHQGASQTKLYFRVADVSGISLTFNTNKPASYKDGGNPSVALTDTGVVLEAHDDNGKIYSSVRRLLNDSVGDAIQDAEFPDPVANSSDPSIAVNARGHAVAVHSVGDDLKWRAGTLVGTSLTWSASSDLATGSSHPSATINDDDVVVVVYQKGDDLYYRVGRYGKSGSITFQPEPRQKYDTGNDASVAIAGNFVFELHRAQIEHQLYQNVGILSSDNTSIEWKRFLGDEDDYYNFDEGEQPSIATNGKVAVQVHKADASTTLFGNACLVFDRGNWISDNFTTLRDMTLRELVLPGSHDAGQYNALQSLQAQTFNISGQLSAGVRWFDLRVGLFGGTLKIHHDIAQGPDFKDVLGQVREFMKDHHELVILKISHFRNVNATSFRSALDLIKDQNNGVGDLLVTRNLGQRLGKTKLRELIGANVGAVLVVVDNKDDGDNVKDFLDFDSTKPINKGIRRYRDWYASDPQNGDLTVFDIYSHTDNFDVMATGTGNDPNDTKGFAKDRDGNLLPRGQFPKFAFFNGNCRTQVNNENVPCDLFLLSWTLTRDAFAPVEYYQPADRQLAAYSEMFPGRNNHQQIINILYTDVSQNARSADVAMIRNGLAR